ncbi:BRCT domain-containing protein [Motiliproteus sp.]|uniref:BRCT domain-containing protein n=1 Tax=Motiliproteus sp. TaxID=1898955 RepID=UPI003BAB5736
MIFEYRNAKDELKRYELKTWQESGHYIKGTCVHDGRYRTFRKDRVSQYLSKHEVLNTPNPPPPPRIREKPNQLEVLFTGFPKVQRAALEQKATDAQMLVRKTVSKKLTFLVGGPNAGPTKLEKSRAQGVYILSEPQFHQMLVTGELQDEVDVI